MFGGRCYGFSYETEGTTAHYECSYFKFTCQREISFLSYFSSRNIEKVFEKVDARKLSHLLYVLCRTDDPSYSSERAILCRCILDGEFDAAEAVRRINGEFIYSNPSVRSG